MEHFRKGLVFSPQVIQPSPLQGKKLPSAEGTYGDISPPGHHSYGEAALREGQQFEWKGYEDTSVQVSVGSLGWDS